jgi:Toprim domain
MANFMASAPELVRALGGRWDGRRGMAKCPAHPDGTPSLAIAEGDQDRPLVFCHGGCTQEAVLNALRAIGLWPDRAETVAYPTLDPAASQARRVQEVMERQRRLERARTIWKDAAPDRCRDLVRAYWRSRGLTIKPPASIRSGVFWHYQERRRMPAAVAVIQGANGRLQGVQLTFLRPDGRGKAEIKCPRLTHGELKGGAVRLAPAGTRLGLAEGIENAATVQQEAGLPCWATLSAGNLSNLPLPKPIREVVLCPDRGHAGEAAAQSATEVYLAMGHQVHVACPPGGFEDFNSALQAAVRMECAA